jgi:hypothetical protein
MISQDRQHNSRALGLGLSCIVHATAFVLFLSFSRPNVAPPKPDDTIHIILLRENEPPARQPALPTPRVNSSKRSAATPVEVTRPLPVLTAPTPEIEIVRQPGPSAVPALDPGNTAVAPGDSAVSPNVGGGAPSVEERILDAASWIRKPTAVDWATNFPRKAKGVADNARVVLSCRITAGNRVKDCRIVSEKPTGYGIGQAVLRMSSMFRVKPVEVDGRPQYDLRVRIPLAFVNPN